MGDIKEKFIGESPLQKKPKKKLGFKLGDKVVKSRHIDDKAVTKNKIADDVAEIPVIANVLTQITNIQEKLSSLKEYFSEIVNSIQFSDDDRERGHNPIDHKITCVTSTIIGGEDKYFILSPQFADEGKVKESIFVVKPSADTKVMLDSALYSNYEIDYSGDSTLLAEQYNVVKITWCLTDEYDPSAFMIGRCFVTISVSSDYMTMINLLRNVVRRKQDMLQWDIKPTKDSVNPVTSDGIYTALEMTALTDQEVENLMPTIVNLF